MSLALVQVSATEFQTVHGHLTSFKPQHRNMHVRDTRQQNGHAVLRSLHAMFATASNEIEGMISGSGGFWHYRIRLVGGRTQMQALVQNCSAADAARIQRRFLPSILKRVRDEQTAAQRPHFSNLTQGQFYLQRHLGGMLPSHSHCLNTVSSGLLAQAFVSQLHPWNLRLIRG